MEKDYILRELRKSEIKDRSGMDGTDNLINALEEYLQNVLPVDLEEAEQKRIRLYTKTFSVIYVNDLNIRLKRIHEWLRTIYSEKALLNKDLSLRLTVIFDEIAAIISVITEDKTLPAPPEPLKNWSEKYFTPQNDDFEHFNNKKISSLIYEFINIINHEMMFAYNNKNNEVLASIRSLCLSVANHCSTYCECVFK